MEIEDALFGGLSGDGECCFTSNSEHIVFVGADGQLKVLNKSDKYQEPEDGEIRQISVNSADSDDDQSLTTVALSKDDEYVIVGGKNHEVKLFKFSTLDFVETLLRLTSPVTSVAVAMDNSLVAIGAEDSIIHLVDLQSRKKVGILEGHNRAIKSLAFDPKLKFLASSSEDGTVKIWDYQERNLIKSISNMSADEIDPVARLSWHPQGKFLSLPGNEDGSLNIYSRSDWTEAFSMRDKHSAPVDAISWSSDGKYILTGGLDYQIYVWNVESKQCISHYKWDAAIKTLAWSHDVTAFVMLDEDARIAVVELNPAVDCKDSSTRSTLAGVTMKNVSGDDSPSPAPVVASTATGNVKDSHESAKMSGSNSPPSYGTEEASGGHPVPPQEDSISHDNSVTSNTKEEDVNTDDDDDDIFNTKSRKLNRLKKQSAMIDSEAAVDASNQEDIGLIKRDLGIVHNEEDRDDAVEKAEALVAREQLRTKGHIGNTATSPMVPETPYQHPFQSSCTPMSNKRRYLCWNAIGCVTSREEDTHCSVEIEFADVNKHRNIRFTDHFNFHLAALGEHGTFFASSSSKVSNITSSTVKKDENPSTIFYRPIQSWSHNSEWLYSLPKGEEAVCVAIGTTWAAVATNRDWLRVFRYSGVQEEILILPGSVVSMTGCGSSLAIVYHKAPPHAGQQNLGFMVINTDTHKEVASGGLPLSTDAELDWFGYDFESEILYAADSAGLVLMLSTVHDYKWLPMLDMADDETCKTAGAYHWIVSVLEGNAMCVVLRGGEQYPPVLPKPLLTPTPLRIPLLALNSKAGVLEEKHLQASIHTASLPQISKFMDDEDLLEQKLKEQSVKSDKIILQMINIAAQADRQVRALDLATKLSLDQSFTIAITIAQRARAGGLAERIDLLRQAKLQEAASDEEIDDGDDEAGDDSIELDGNYTSVSSVQGRGKRACNEGQRDVGRMKKQKLGDNSANRYESDQDNQNNNNTNTTTTNNNKLSSIIKTSPMKKKASRNPFAKCTTVSPVKRSSALNVLKNLKSPKIIPKLNRESSFANNARIKNRNGFIKR